MNAQTFVIVGASLAGAKAAEELRERGFDGRVVLVGTENELPYERPPLSKDYLRGESELDSMRVHDDAFYRELIQEVFGVPSQSAPDAYHIVTLETCDCADFRHHILDREPAQHARQRGRVGADGLSQLGAGARALGEDPRHPELLRDEEQLRHDVAVQQAEELPLRFDVYGFVVERVKVSVLV